MKKVVLGIDIGGTNTVFGFIEKSGNILFSEHFPTFGHEPADGLVNRLAEKVDSFLEDHPEGELAGIGVGAPNGNHYNGVIHSPPNLSWGHVDIVSLLRKNFNCDILLTNDANAAALGEKYFGIAKDMKDFITITLGTGLGSGIFSGGKILYGHDSLAGEIGHLSIDHNGRKCSCGLKGCLEMYASAKGIKETVIELLQVNPSDDFLSSLDLDCVDGKIIDRAFDDGVESAISLYEFTAEKLAYGLAQTAVILNPEAFIFYGGFSLAGDRLLNPTRRALESYLMKHSKEKIRILQSGLPPEQAGILGAASLIWPFDSK
ncbi:MAG: ROK family protein [Candidatus Marinimicrobia bacterium]|nr:ROK family protein [Candidatus Neomarinimicrobiota bacterium]MDP7436719.1 ROK family protein [Candidatus Neomarinimicrobiota bacterium]